FCKSALSRFAPNDFIEMLGRHGIAFYEKEEGQLFCKESSAAITNMLGKECSEAGVEIQLNCEIRSIKKEDGFVVSSNRGTFRSESLVVATGGLSYPELGATDLGYRIAKQFGLGVTALKPGLVPIIFNQKDMADFSDLSGVSVEALVSVERRRFRGNILFTHRGLSGPAVLQASSCWNPGDVVHFDLLPDTDICGLFMTSKQSRIELRNFLSMCLPRRFAYRWCELYAASRPLCQLSERDLKKAADQLHNWEIVPGGTEGYRRAEVTLGGVGTDELSSRTMGAKKIRGLFFVGEVIDVTGQLGGYNLQWAWASGYAAGQYV
ncbi:MAG TPA: aminoacetone oxidase family FAD-binding enzyme, partial [Thermodesulfovibrionales bacterium]|nr:aminoacetone oxidase family FAD-binding enzyme [Thermodesulfovibrionales bacterium]